MGARRTGGGEHGGREARAELGCRRVGKSARARACVCVCVCAHKLLCLRPPRAMGPRQSPVWLGESRQAGSSSRAAGTAEQCRGPAPALAPRHRPPLPHRYPGSPSALGASQGHGAPLQRALQQCCSRAGSAPARGTAGRAGLAAQPKSPKVQRGRGRRVLSAGGRCERGAACPGHCAPHGAPAPRRGRFSGSSVPPRAAAAASPPSHLSGDPVESNLPGTLLHQLPQQRLALNNPQASRKFPFPLAQSHPPRVPLPLPRGTRSRHGRAACGTRTWLEE